MTAKLIIRGMILFGSVYPAIIYFWKFHQLSKAVDLEKSDFEKEQLLTEFKRAQSKILYGRTLSYEQKRSLESIYVQLTNLGFEKHTINKIKRRLMLGLHINFKTGQFNERKINNQVLSFLLTTLTLIVSFFLTSLLLKLGELSSHIYIKSIIISIYTLLLGLPLIFYTYMTIAPISASKIALKNINLTNRR